MKIKVTRTELKEIQSFRVLFLHENNFQIRYNACHERNWSDSYRLENEGIQIGYGSVKGKDNYEHRDAIFEFFVLPHLRKLSSTIFFELIQSSAAEFVECQSNDQLLSSMLFEFTQDIYSDVILFEDYVVTEYLRPEVIFRRRNNDDKIFEHKSEPIGDYVLEKQGKVIATGGFLLHYNMPFADLYMEVEENEREKGFGSFIIQELKKECYIAGRVPAARCNIQNIASKATLLKAGLRICGFMLTGEIKNTRKKIE